MNDLELRLRDALRAPGWDAPPPADPRGWVRARVATDRRRRALLLPALAAVLAAGVAAGSSLLSVKGQEPAPTVATPLTASTVRDGLRMTLRLDSDAPRAGNRVTGEIRVENLRSDPVGLILACGQAPSLTVDFAPALAADAPADVQADPAADFARRLLSRQSNRPQDAFFSVVPSAYQVPADAPADCPVDPPPTALDAGGAVVRQVDWVAQTPGGAVSAAATARVFLGYVLPPDAAGNPVEGDPSSQGSTTPSARLLTLTSQLAVEGDPDRVTLGDAVRAATADARFADVLRESGSTAWEQAWALPFDKQGTSSFGQADTDRAFGPVATWHVAVVVRSQDGRNRTTAQIDGRTAEVLDVQTQPERP